MTVGLKGCRSGRCPSSMAAYLWETVYIVILESTLRSRIPAGLWTGTEDGAG